MKLLGRQFNPTRANFRKPTDFTKRPIPDEQSIVAPTVVPDAIGSAGRSSTALPQSWLRSGKKLSNTSILSLANSVQVMLDVQGPSEDAQDITVTLSMGDPGNKTHLWFTRVIGRIDWGTGGFQHSAFVDWTPGQVFCIHGSSVRVTAILQSPAARTQPITASISCGSGPRTAVFSAKFALTALTEVEIAVPAFARSLLVNRFVPGNAPFPPLPALSIRMTDLAAAPTSGFRVAQDACQATPVPLDPSACDIVVRNEDPINQANGSVSFGLAL